MPSTSTQNRQLSDDCTECTKGRPQAPSPHPTRYFLAPPGEFGGKLTHTLLEWTHHFLREAATGRRQPRAACPTACRSTGGWTFRTWPRSARVTSPLRLSAPSSRRSRSSQTFSLITPSISVLTFAVQGRTAASMSGQYLTWNCFTATTPDHQAPSSAAEVTKLKASTRDNLTPPVRPRRQTCFHPGSQRCARPALRGGDEFRTVRA